MSAAGEASESERRVDGAAVAAGKQQQAVEDELMFARVHFDALQSALMQPCTVDACAAADGSNALLPDFCARDGKSFFERNFTDGEFLFIHPPRTDRESFLLKYKAAKAKSPGLGACILLPAKLFSPLLKGMKQCTHYSRNTALFTDAKTGKAVKARCDFVVWIDPPQPAASTAAVAAHTHGTAGDKPATQADAGCKSAASHTMQLLGAVAGAPARVLIDTGAEQHHYISARFCAAHGIKMRNNKEPISVTGVAGAAISAARCCTVKIRLQGLGDQLNFVVIDMPSPFDVILGDAWLKSMKAKLDFAGQTCTVFGKGKKPITLVMDSPAHAGVESALRRPAVLSYLQAKRLCKQAVWHHLVVVKEVEEASATVAVAAAESHVINLRTMLA